MERRKGEGEKKKNMQNLLRHKLRYKAGVEPLNWTQMSSQDSHNEQGIGGGGGYSVNK